MNDHSHPRDDKFFTWLRQLKTTRHDSKWLGGVASGIAERFDVDVVLVRGIFVALSILGGLGMIIYGLAWALLPDESGRIHLERALAKDWTTGMTGAVVMVALGVFPVPWFLDTLAPVFWPVAIVAAIALLVFSRKGTKFDVPRAAKPSSQPAGQPGAPHEAPHPTVHGTAMEKPWRSAADHFEARAAAPQSDAAAGKENPMQSDQPTGGTGPKDYDYSYAPDPEYTKNYYEQMHAKAQQKAAKRAPQPAPVPGWVATIVVGLSVLVMAVVLSIDYLNIVALPRNGWPIALAAGLLVVGLSLIFASMAKRTSGGILGLAIPLLVLTLVFGGSSLTGGGRSIHDAAVQDGQYAAVFSNKTIDLSQKGMITEDTTVAVDSLFSNFDLKLPDNVPVTINSRGAFLSDLDSDFNRESDDFPAGTPRLTVEISGLFSSFDTELVRGAQPSNTGTSF